MASPPPPQAQYGQYQPPVSQQSQQYGHPQHPQHQPQGYPSSPPPPHLQPQRHSSYGLPPSPTNDPRIRTGTAPSSSTGARHSPAPSTSNQSRDGSAPTRPTSQLPSAGSTRSLASQPGNAPPTIAGEDLHDLDRAKVLIKCSKFYAEGFLMKKVEATPEGKAPTNHDGQWAKWFVQLSGSVMSTWNAADMEAAARENRTVPPQYLNLQDAFVHPLPPHPRGPKTPTQFQFALNSAGQNRILFCAPSLQSLSMWLNAIRLSFWERSRCNEIWTGALLGNREPRPLGWQGYDAGLPPAHGGAGADTRKSSTASGRFEGWLKARLPGETEWRRVWIVVVRGSNVPSRASVLGRPGAAPAEEKKSRRTSLLSFGNKKEKKDEIAVEDLPGGGTLSTLAFFDRKPAKKEQPLCVAQHVYYAAAIYPDHDALLESSTMFKVEGSFLSAADGWNSTGYGVGGRAEKQGHAYLMLEEGSSMDMLYWIVGIADAFKLYGRPRQFSFDPRDPNSLYFALPIGPQRDRLFLDRELVDNLNINEGRPRAIRATFHNILFDRMRGVRSTALPGPPPPQDTRGTPSPRGSTPTSVDPSDAPRRWSQQPPQLQQQLSRNDSPQLPPVLPTIGEGSLVDDARAPISGPTAVTNDFPSPRAAPSPIEPQGVDARRMSLHRQSTADRRRSQYGAIEGAPTPQQPEEAVATPVNHVEPTPDYLGLQRPSREASGGDNDLAAYAAYLSSDIAREQTPSPPPSAAAMPVHQSQQPYGEPGRHVPPVDTAADAHVPSSNGLPSLHLPPVAATEDGYLPQTDANRAIPTHLTYAAPAAASSSHHSYEQFASPPVSQQQQQHLSPLYPPDSPRMPLPSPGAASMLSSGAPPSPGLPYLASSPAAEQQSFEQGGAQIAAPAPPIPAAPLEREPEQQLPSSAGALTPLQGETTHSDAPPDMRVDEAHNGHIVESPENVALESPTDQTLTTQPLFAGSPRPSQLSHTIEQPQEHSPVAEPQRAMEPQREELRPDLRVETRQAQPAQNVSQGHKGYDLPEEYNIHSDLIAALHFVDRSESPDPATPHTLSSVEPSPALSGPRAFHVGPPRRGMFDRETSPSDELYGSENGEATTAAPRPLVEVFKPEVVAAAAKPASSQPSASSTPSKQQTFPSSFANNKREERAAAAQLAQQAQQAALTRPGRAPGAKLAKKKAWEDSDEDEDAQEDEDESSEDEAPPARVQPSASSGSLAPTPAPASRGVSPIPSSTSMDMARPRPQYSNSPQRSPAVDPAARQSYLENGPSPANYSNSAPPASPIYAEMPEVTDGQPHRKPALNPHGLLATGMIEKEERSARAQENAARDTGGTLVSLPAKAPPPQTGLVGALTSHQREKERTGGVGRALTEQQRERKLAEQRQKQLDELQKQQLAMMQQQMQMAQFGGGGSGFAQMGTMGYGGSNPWMMGGMGMMSPMGMGGYGAFPGMSGTPTGMGGSPQLQPQHTGDGASQQAQAFQQQQQAMMAAQAAAQHAAQQAAQQAYLAAMAQFQGASSPTGGTSPTLPPTSFPSLPSMQFMPSPFGYPASPSMGFGGFTPGHVQQPSMSMYGAPGFGGMPVPGADAENGTGRAVSPLDLKGPQAPARREGSD
ncbi:hypothetical protein JCM3770_001402 [Rhodotorula araucariae]